MTKRNLLDPAEAFAKAIGSKKVCAKCTPFERARFMGHGSGDHLQCSDPECGCRCQDNARTN